MAQMTYTLECGMLPYKGEYGDSILLGKTTFGAEIISRGQRYRSRHRKGVSLINIFLNHLTRLIRPPLVGPLNKMPLYFKQLSRIVWEGGIRYSLTYNLTD